MKPGETITEIVDAFNEKLIEIGVKKKISVKSVLNANPDVDPKNMPVGRVLIIPDPSNK